MMRTCAVLLTGTFPLLFLQPSPAIAVTSGCDSNGCGTVFSVNPDTGKERVVYSFQSNGADGWDPEGQLIDIDRQLYGTTQYGGTNGDGTIFSVNLTTGIEKILYSFGGADGQIPAAGVKSHDGVLYGTTAVGGSDGDGVVFSFSLKTGIESVLHSFSGTDGVEPQDSLTIVKGLLYGTTTGGGANNAGTVFSVDPITGSEKVLYSFTSNGTDGYSPYANLTHANVAGVLYGTTEYGGQNLAGTVFSINLSTLVETVLYSFTGGADGGVPYGNVKNLGDYLYGTTVTGGSGGEGTVFSLNLTNGAETTLHSFQFNGTDGQQPFSGLKRVDHKLYGTTTLGGTGGCSDLYKATRDERSPYPQGCGTVYRVTESGREVVVYSFKGGSDGAFPSANLTQVGGKLYGTTVGGGTGTKSRE